ncbi:MAG TPA: hypothetical protein VKB57_23740 [Acidimicrobiales bacterium]|nr:hypothetical protein [Acidimicrobiales bacterium]
MTDRRPEIVEVVWHDSVGEHQWLDLEDARRSARDDGMLQRSVGWLLADEPGYLLLALSRSESWEQVDLTLQIPRGCIVRSRVLRHGNGAPQ